MPPFNFATFFFFFGGRIFVSEDANSISSGSQEKNHSLDYCCYQQLGSELGAFVKQ